MKPSQAIEIVSNVENSNDLLLCGIDGIENANYDYSVAYHYGTISSNNSVSNVFGLGENNKFFYILMCFRNNEIIRYESGNGYAYEKNGKQYFHRYLPMYEGKNPEHQQLVKKNQEKFICINDAVNVLVSSFPPDYSLNFYDKNCILASLDKSIPHAIQVLENSFLARVDVNDISSVSFDSKVFSDIVAEALTKYTKQLSLKTSKFSINKLSVKQLQLEPFIDSNVKKGTFIYDETTDTVKFYNGEKWRTLQWVDEESA
jgi:hypothetical protein